MSVIFAYILPGSGMKNSKNIDSLVIFFKNKHIIIYFRSSKNAVLHTVIPYEINELCMWKF